jgi:hypothetical protein
VADVIQLADYRDPGNGARGAVERYFADFPNAARVSAVLRADHFLFWLWSEGFQVVPLDGSDNLK